MKYIFNTGIPSHREWGRDREVNWMGCWALVMRSGATNPDWHRSFAGNCVWAWKGKQTCSSLRLSQSNLCLSSCLTLSSTLGPSRLCCPCSILFEAQIKPTKSLHCLPSVCTNWQVEDTAEMLWRQPPSQLLGSLWVIALALTLILC